MSALVVFVCLRAALLAISLVLSVAMVARSEAATEERHKKRSEYELEVKKLKRDDPKKYEDVKRAAILYAQVLLGRLGYGVGPYNGVLDEKTQTALREYQMQRALPVTGDPLSFETSQQIEEDMNLLDYEPVILPDLFVFLDLWQSGYVSAKGTWVLTGEKMGLPEQTSHIQCFRDRRVCIEAIALIEGRGENRLLTLTSDEYEIERWDDYEIVTKPKQFGCVRYIRRVNRVQKSVTGLRSTTSTDELCKGLETKELHTTLSDGFKVYWELYENSKKALRKLMRFSPEVLRSLEQKPSK